MRKHLAWGLLAVLLAGCGSSGDSPADGEPPDPNANVMAWPEGTKTTGGAAVVKLEGVTDISLAELLGAPRSDLATRADECLQSIQYLEKLHDEGNMPFHLLPDAYASAVAPVLRQAKFSPERGFSVPPYLPEGRPDTELALHLARYGDIEAAHKLVNPADVDATRELDGFQLERNYPVEWTRLIGLLLRRSMYHLLMGHVDEAKQLIGLHQQLEKLLGPKARSSPLGVELLSRGQSILYQAAGAWRASRQESLANQAEAFAAGWGETPRLTLAYQSPLPRARAERLFDAKSSGRALSAPSPLRVLDLLGLPVPDYGLENAVGTFNGDRLTETLLLYRTREESYYPRPEALTHVLMDCLNQPVKTATATPLDAKLWHTLPIGSVHVDIGVVLHNPEVSALVRVRTGDAMSPGEGPKASLQRDFGPVGLDRSFEQTRRRVALHQRASAIKVTGKKALEDVHSAITALPISSLAIERAEGFDVPARLTLSFAARKKNPVSLGALADPLWALAGPAHISGGRGSRPLTLAWQDDHTSYVLRLPNRKDDDLSLAIAPRGKEDRSPAADGDWVDRPETDVAARAALVLAREREERRTRIENGKPWARLPRDLEKIHLGMTKEQVQQALPPDFKAYKRPIPNGILVAVTSPPAGGPLPAAREIAALFDGAGRVVEVIARYQSGSGPAGLAKIEGSLEKRAGAPETTAGPWAQIWSDLPKRKPAPVLRRWQDDITLLTCQQDGSGIELRLRDCPVAHEEGAPAPALAYLPRGPEDCLLGTTREALFRQWKVTKPTTSNGALVLAPRAGSPYDALLVWFKDNRVSQIVARHRTKASSTPAQAAAVVSAAWGQEGRKLGLPWRQDFAENNTVQGWTTQDDVTRVRIFWQQRDSDGMRQVFTEWRDLGK
jgi:hypothetical protein